MAALVRGLRIVLAKNVCTLRTLPRIAVIGIQHKSVLHNITAGSLLSSKISSSQECWLQAGHVRHFADAKPTMDQIRERVIKVCAAFDKVTADKLTLDSHFINDLGLDSLDHVEVIMAMEDEFGFEIPDSDAEKLVRPADIVRYVADKEDIYD